MGSAALPLVSGASDQRSVGENSQALSGFVMKIQTLGGDEGDLTCGSQPLENKDIFYSDCCRCGILL